MISLFGVTETILCFVCVLLVVLIILIVFLIVSRKNSDILMQNSLKENKNDEATNVDKINSKFLENRAILTDKIKDMEKSINEILSKNNDVIKNVEGKFARIDATQQQLTGLDKNIEELKLVLSGNQQRGQYGERTLELILFNVYGDTDVYKTQYTLQDGSKPDAVVFCPAPYNAICIDAKFPFNNYAKIIFDKEEKDKSEFKRNIKKQIDEIATKYVSKSETAKFAFMFIPNDAIYIYIHNELNEIVEYAEKKQVILSSPSTIYPFLTTLNSIRYDYKIQQNAKDIVEIFKKLSREMDDLLKLWESLKKQQQACNNKIEEIDKKFDKTRKTIQNVSNDYDDEQ